MKNLTLAFFIQCVVLALLTSCNKEQECKGVVPHYASSLVNNFTDPIAPLTGTDTLKFLYNGTDTQLYVGQGVQLGSKIRYGVTPGECDEEYQYLIYTYKCINNPVFSFRMEYNPYTYTRKEVNTPSNFYFKNLSVGEFLLRPRVNDSVIINGRTFYEPYYLANGPDTLNYFMISLNERNGNVFFLKIKYVYDVLTLLK